MKNMTVVLLLMFAVIAAGVIAQGRGVPSIGDGLEALQAQVAALDARIDDLEIAPQPQSAGFLKIGDIKGESADESHKEWIDVLSIGNSIDAVASSSTRVGRVEFTDIVITKKVDKSSPKLAEAVAKGTHIPTVELELAKETDDGARQTYLKYELKNVIVTSYSVNAAGESAPTETLSLNFEEIKVVYTERDSDGSEKGNVEFEWKVEEGES